MEFGACTQGIPLDHRWELFKYIVGKVGLCGQRHCIGCTQVALLVARWSTVHPIPRPVTAVHGAGMSGKAQLGVFVVDIVPPEAAKGDLGHSPQASTCAHCLLKTQGCVFIFGCYLQQV